MNHMLTKSATTKPHVPIANILATEANYALKVVHWSSEHQKLLPGALHTNNVQVFRLYSWNWGRQM